jgi:torso-like protein
MEFCDNLRQLLQAYFRDFVFERLERPWRAFTASWSRTAVARHLGINTSYTTGQHCYVLVCVIGVLYTSRIGVSMCDVLSSMIVLRSVISNILINTSVSQE